MSFPTIHAAMRAGFSEILLDLPDRVIMTTPAREAGIAKLALVKKS